MTFARRFFPNEESEKSFSTGQFLEEPERLFGFIYINLADRIPCMDHEVVTKGNLFSDEGREDLVVDAVTFDDSLFLFLVYFNYLTWYP